MNKRQQKQTLKRITGTYESLWRHWTTGTRRIMLRKIVKFADENKLELDNDFRVLLKIHETGERKYMDIKKDNENDAHEFINGYGHDTPETREEFQAILASFGTTSAHYALKWSADWILNAANASGEQRTKEFAENMAMTIRAVAEQAVRSA